MISERELHRVELVSPSGQAIGATTVAAAHTAPGSLHRAFSVLVFDPAGRTLLQQRAARKTRFALRWANACCGHPEPGEPVTVAAARRLKEELGVGGVELAEAGVYVYEATDPATGLIEREFDHVLVGRVDDNLTTNPDPSEVASVRWATVESLAASTDVYVPWLAGVLSVAHAFIPEPDIS